MHSTAATSHFSAVGSDTMIAVSAVDCFATMQNAHCVPWFASQS